MQNKKVMWMFVAAVLLIPITVFGIVHWCQSTYEKLPILGEKGHTIPDFELRNQYGNATSTKSWNNRIVVVNFFFTHCPSICPKMMYQLKRVQAYSGVDDLNICSFTVDPERDSVERLKAYAGQMELHGDWELITGDKKELYRLARKSFYLDATDGDSGANDFIHSDKLVLIDKEKRIRGFYNGTDEADVNKLITDIKKLQMER